MELCHWATKKPSNAKTDDLSRITFTLVGKQFQDYHLIIQCNNLSESTWLSSLQPRKFEIIHLSSICTQILLQGIKCSPNSKYFVKGKEYKRILLTYDWSLGSSSSHREELRLVEFLRALNNDFRGHCGFILQ